MDPISHGLLEAQNKAERLFAAVVEGGLIRPGMLESELSTAIHTLARSQFGVRRHWHKRIARTGPNALLGYHDEPPDRAIAADDVLYLDLGPVFGEWEADFGRSYALGSDPDKQRLVRDLALAFQRGKALYENTPDLTAGQLYDYVAGLAGDYGWTFVAPTAGHLVGHFPHEKQPSGDPKRLSIRPGNSLKLREPDAQGNPRHWILEIHFGDEARQFGGFYEELLTVATE